MDADGVAAATLAEMQQQSAALERLAPEILQAFLEGQSWAGALDSFFAKHAVLFKGFVVGEEYSLQQTEVRLWLQPASFSRSSAPQQTQRALEH